MPDQDAQVTAAYSGRDEVYEPSEAFRNRAHISSMEEYEEMYERSIEDPEAFWGEQADRIDWFEPFDTVRNVSYEPRDVDINWYEGGVTNACYNAVDRHLDDKADDVARRIRQTLFRPRFSDGMPVSTDKVRWAYDISHW